MTIAALELNDQMLLIEAEDGSLHAEPGFARLTKDGIVTGETARAVAWREPQHVYHQYWCNLNQTSLPIRHRHARHHADIAFAQLRALWQGAGSPTSLIVLVPGSFARDQLSLLLGMVEALPSVASAVIDSALAACADAQQNTLFVDLQMHESVLTVCQPRGDAISIVDQEVLPGLGMGQLQNALARHISDLMIGSYRFDPLHSSETEQAIFDQIPHWLTRLGWESDVSIKLSTEHGEHPCILNRDVIKSLIGERLASVRSFLEKWQGCVVLLSHASGLLTGLVDEFSEARVAGQTAATERCLLRYEEILEQVDDLYRVRSLPRSETDNETTGMNGQSLATHLLFGNRALPLDQPVSIRLGEDEPHMSSEWDENAALTVVIRDQTLETLQRSADVSLPRSCLPGESIRIGGHELKLIRVGND
jgi:hypothetical protein